MFMPFTEFLELVQNSNGVNSDWNFYKLPHSSTKFICSNLECTGGYAGGNCYGSVAKPYNEDYKLDYSENLELFLLTHFQNLPLNVAFKIMANMESETFTEYEYYGNSCNYIYMVIETQTFYDILKEFYDNIT